MGSNANSKLHRKQLCGAFHRQRAGCTRTKTCPSRDRPNQISLKETKVPIGGLHSGQCALRRDETREQQGGFLRADGCSFEDQVRRALFSSWLAARSASVIEVT
jgi:hypothetical protein